MTLHIVLHPAAADEVQEAERHYSAVHPELGEAFVMALDAALERAQRFPESGRAWRKSDPGRRVYGVSGFPYVVIARIRPEELRIIAVAHQRRRPGYWLERER